MQPSRSYTLRFEKDPGTGVEERMHLLVNGQGQLVLTLTDTRGRYGFNSVSTEVNLDALAAAIFKLQSMVEDDRRLEAIR